VSSVRAKIPDLVFQVYGRPLHPELFEVTQTRTIQRGAYEARIDITTCGHVVTWKCQGLTLTEVTADASDPLPQRRRLLSYKIKGERADRVQCRGGATYQVNFQLEPIEPEIFWGFQTELANDGEREGMLHLFSASGRMSLGGLSLIKLETRPRAMLVQTFHTFPDDFAVVKSQSLFELPGRKA